MIMNRNGTSGSSRLRALLCLLFAISAGLVVLAGIASSREIELGGWASAEHEGLEIGRVAADGPTPTPLPCPLCWFPRTQSDNFDYLTPPELPSGWLATNALGPPPLWVTSNPGLPMPPADTAPNALFIDD